MAHSFTSPNGSVSVLVVDRARLMCRCADGSVQLLRVYHSLSETLAACNLLIEAHLLKLRTQRAAVLADPQRPRIIYVERWVGTATHGDWVTVLPGDFRRQVYGRWNAEKNCLELVVPRVRCEFFDHAPRVQRGANSAAKPSSNAGRINGSARSIATKAPIAPAPVRGADVAMPQVPAGVKLRKSAAHNTANDQDIDLALLTTGDLVNCVLSGRTRKNGWFARLMCGAASGPISNASRMPEGLEVGQSVQLRLNGINIAKQFASFRWCE